MDTGERKQTYERFVKDKTAEQILKAASDNYDEEPYLRVAAAVRSNIELTEAQARASDDSSRAARAVRWLTLVLAVAAIMQVIATAWPYLAWWRDHG